MAKRNGLCRIFGHSTRHDTVDIAGPLTCSRCGHTKKGIEWPRGQAERDEAFYRRLQEQTNRLSWPGLWWHKTGDKAVSDAPVMRAKLQIQSVKEVKPWKGSGHAPTEELRFSAVCGKWNDDGEGEDNNYARFTPTAALEMTITNPALIGKFKPGQTFYVDFIDADGEAD